MVFQYLKGVSKHEGNQLFTSVDSDRTRGNNFRLNKGRFRLEVGRSCESSELLEQAAGTGCPERVWMPSP